MEVKHIIDIDFVARNNTPVVHLVQYDDGLPSLVVRVFQNGSPLVLSAEELTASLRFMKQDGNFVLSPGTIAEKEISFKIPSSMTVFQGKYPGKVELKDTAGHVVCSATIVFDIDKNPVQKDAVESDSDYKDYIDKVLGQIPGFDACTKAELATNLIDQPTVHATNTIGSSEIALQSGKRYFIEGTDASQSPQVTMVLNNVTAKTNIEVFCKFAHNVILALEHPNTTLETYEGGDLETKIAALNEASRTGTGYLHLKFIGLQANQCAVLISN